jgi:phosphatidylinositol alpha-1,6-mannosyltransferase
MTTSSRVRVLMTTELFAPGGVQRLGRDSIAAIAEMGPLEVWSLRDSSVAGDFQAPAGVELRLAGGSALRLGAWSLARALRPSGDPDLVVLHVHLAPVALPLILRGARVSLFLLGVEAWRPLTRVERMLVERCDRLIAISSFAAGRFKTINPWAAAVPIDVCPLGVAPLPEGDAALPADGDESALIVSRMDAADRYKGHELLLRAWPAVRRRRPRATLVMAGEGNDRARLESVAQSLGLANAVRFTGFVDEPQLADLYRRCALFVMPSVDEGFGLVFLEAMRAGKPCIGARGAAEEVIVDGVTGVILPSVDEPAVADAVVRLFDSPTLRHGMGQAGHRRFEQMFKNSHFAERLRNLLAREPRSSKGAAA